MLIAFFISIALFIVVVESDNVTITRTYHSYDSDETYQRFIQTIYRENAAVYFDSFEYNDYVHYKIRHEHPLEFEKYKYYWSENHEELKEYRHLCEYYFSGHDSLELFRTHYPNNTQPKSFFFHCSFPYSCIGIECQIETRFVLGVIFVLGLILSLYFARKCIMKEIKQMEKIRDQCTRPQYPRGPRFMPPMTPLEAPPPSYNVVFSSTSPPSYESVVRDKVTYTLPSYTSVA
ncbi:hypothetical protein CRE_11250 [Caenorhabditis remanei]|uniref:CX domain-containing protein n=1 Tax=Caenorhabditis remanei TaxID=31234 RepID=E3MQ65_CAERE|nr:hypothetical protein CRE_11250 [Caenorhabditis remanei]